MILGLNSMNTDRGFLALLMNGEGSSSSFYTSPPIIGGQSTANLVSCLNPSSPLFPYNPAYPNHVYDENNLATAAGFVPDNIIVPNIEAAVPFNLFRIPLDPTPISRVYDLSVTDSINAESSSSTRRLGGDSKTMESLVNNFQLSSSDLTGVKYPLMPEENIDQMYTSSLARNRRQNYNDKIWCLEKILPWDKEMNRATLLEETYKYVKFLQTQVSILESMPHNSSTSSSSTSHTTNTSIPAGDFYGDFYGGLGKLNRQQLLQVLVNSSVAQTLMYSQGCCVCSVEQLDMLRELEKTTKANQTTVPFDPADHSLI